MEIDVIEVFRQEYRLAKREAEYWNSRLAICRQALDTAITAQSRLTKRAVDGLDLGGLITAESALDEGPLTSSPSSARR